MIEIDKLRKSYGNQKVLKEISLEFSPGQSIALIGPNGSGKTTLLKCILGLVWSDSGEIRFNGKEISGSYEYRKDIGYMPQINRSPQQLTTDQFFRMIKGMRESNNELDTELYDELDIKRLKNKKLGTLSGGMMQQVSAALAFLFNPGVLILDEPTAGLDPVSNELLKEKINRSSEEKKLIITTSHILNDLDDIAKQVVYLMDGEIRFFKTLDELKQETSESKLNKIIASILNNNPANEQDQLLHSKGPA